LTMQRTRPFTEPLKSDDNSIDLLFRVFADADAPIGERKKAREGLRNEARRALKLFYHPLLAQMGPLLEEFKELSER
jgi:hypothetical protein